MLRICCAPDRHQRKYRNRCNLPTATWSVYCRSFHSGSRAPRDLKVAGALQERLVINFAADHGVRANQHAFAALNADLRIPNRDFSGQISLFVLGCAGWESAIVRKRAHRHRSPRPAMISPRTLRTNSGVSLRCPFCSRRRRRRYPVFSPHISAKRLIDRPQIHFHRLLAFFCVRFANRTLDGSIASVAGSTPEMAKKQVCITVLMRPPMPASRATLFASMTKKWACVSINLRCVFSGKCDPDPFVDQIR